MNWLRHYIAKPKTLADNIALFIMGAAFVALLALVGYSTWPLKTVDIKVPVATDKAEYRQGETISGLFFGEVYYEGKVEIIRQVFCRGYSAYIKTDDGSNVYRTISVPKKLEGRSVEIGQLPANIPNGRNCIVRFVNTYYIPTPFGTREINVDYYTQTFTVVDG